MRSTRSLLLDSFAYVYFPRRGERVILAAQRAEKERKRKIEEERMQSSQIGQRPDQHSSARGGRSPLEAQTPSASREGIKASTQFIPVPPSSSSKTPRPPPPDHPQSAQGRKVRPGHLTVPSDASGPPATASGPVRRDSHRGSFLRNFSLKNGSGRRLTVSNEQWDALRMLAGTNNQETEAAYRAVNSSKNATTRLRGAVSTILADKAAQLHAEASPPPTSRPRPFRSIRSRLTMLAEADQPQISLVVKKLRELSPRAGHARSPRVFQF